MMLRPKSLFGRTAITISLTLLAFIAIAAGAAYYFIYVPMARRYADDFAAVIVSAAHSLQSLPEEMHEELREQLLVDHGLIVAPQELEQTGQPSDLQYYPFFRESLARRAGEELQIIASANDPLVWVDVPAHGKLYRVGFDSTRLGTNPPVVVILVIAGGALLALAASILEVRRVVRPLDTLSSAAQKLGHGLSPPHLSEDGPEEIAALARAFNGLSSDLRQLSENRTVMIAGISHDLRTPLTRITLALEMLDDATNPELVESIRRNLDVMNRLIGQFLQFSEGVEDALPVQLDLWQVIASLASDVEREGAKLVLHRRDPPCVYYADPVALERVLSNLLTNAAQYSGGAPIDVSLHCSVEEVAIEICDRGPGIPASEVDAVFRPFHRLETARTGKTGGSGLGLAIAGQLARKHGWKIDLLPRDGGGTVAKLGLSPSQRFSLC